MQRSRLCLFSLPLSPWPLAYLFIPKTNKFAQLRCVNCTSKHTHGCTHDLTPGDLCGSRAAAICDWNEFFLLVSSGRDLSPSFVCPCPGFVGIPTAPLSPTTPSSECWFLIISPVVICHVDQRAASHTCAVWELNSNGGGAGHWEGNYEAHSERRFIQPAGTLFCYLKGFFLSFCFGEAAAQTSPVSACPSVTHQK